MDGFWLPQNVREQVLSPGTQYKTLSFARGRPCSQDDENAVTARWPVLGQGAWAQLLKALNANRQRAPQGAEYWERFQAALAVVGQRLADPADPLRVQALATLPTYTGYSEAMIRLALDALDMWAMDKFPSVFQLLPTQAVATDWHPMGDLPGRVRFFPVRRWPRLPIRRRGRGKRSFFSPPSSLDLVVGYGAGNVPGTALLISLLTQATTLAGGPQPAVLVRNSRREPILAPLVLGALEDVDPDLVSTLAVLIWDHEDIAVEKGGQPPVLLALADLVIAAASDETISQIEQAIQGMAAVRRTTHPNPVRFHAHGHKVSFAAIGREVLERGCHIEAGGPPLLDVVALLAALDSVFWDQHGCLSARFHFVEAGSGEHFGPLDYARRLVDQLERLAVFLPRGAWPRRSLHDRFDRYTALEQTGKVQVVSGYDDEFLVIVDSRPLTAVGFQALVNDCEGRVIVVRPVADLTDVPNNYLRLLPAANLQSLSVAVGRAGKPLSDRFLHVATACGGRGVTAIRTVGRGAFPQLAYSWDGLLPPDLVRSRPEGHFTTIEFDAPYDEMIATYRQFLQRGAALRQ
jgi:hypothetical protein